MLRRAEGRLVARYLAQELEPSSADAGGRARDASGPPGPTEEER
jgi:hypothetical protein